MIVALKKIAIIASLGIFGIHPVWCDSCGEMVLQAPTFREAERMYTENLNQCDVCSSMVCDMCANDYEDLPGCYVCNGKF